MLEKIYLCIDLKSFYASVECVERGLDPMTTPLVVADPERTDKTICLAVSPALKAHGVPGRCRVFEIPKHLSYIMAPPRMQKYIDYSADIYSIYLKYVAKEDIHVYSIDEAFLDVTDYLYMYNLSPRTLSFTIMQDILQTTGITASCGIGTNLYLSKIALDITAKHSSDHIGYLDEELYRHTLWDHEPLTDFWRIGPGISHRLNQHGIRTMGQIAEADEEFLYRLFGVDAELLIDHAWGRESTTITQIKAFRPKNNSLTSGQVLMHDTNHTEGRLIVKEMADLLCLDLVEKEAVTSSITLHLGYSNELHMDSAHGTLSLSSPTSSAHEILLVVEKLYDRIKDPRYPLRRIHLTFNRVTEEIGQQYDLFSDPAKRERERCIQKAMVEIKKKYGKNAILKGMNLEEGATTMERNRQIGGHKA